MKSFVMKVTLAAFLQFVAVFAIAAEIYRIDSKPYSSITRTGNNKKSYVDLKSAVLVPANINGKISITDHIARSRNRALKDNSQFTSFSTLKSLSSYYGGGYKITVDLDILEQDIARGLLPKTRIHYNEVILKNLEGEMDQLLNIQAKDAGIVNQFKKEMQGHLADYYAMVRIQELPTEVCDKFFWKGVNAFRDRYPDLFEHLNKEQYSNYSYLFNALRHAKTDHEVLVEGPIPSKYFQLEKLDKNDQALNLMQNAAKSLAKIKGKSCQCNLVESYL